MNHTIFASIVAQTLAASDPSALLTPQRGFEHYISPCPISTSIVTKVPADFLHYQTDRHTLHGIIIDHGSKQHLVYEPLGALREKLYDALRRLRNFFLFLGGMRIAHHLILQGEYDSGWGSRNDLGLYPKIGLGIGAIALAETAWCYYRFKSSSMRPQHTPLEITRANTLKKRMQLPNAVMAEHLCVREIPPTEEGLEVRLPVFRCNNSLATPYARVNKLIGELNAISNRGQLKAWCGNYGDPQDKLQEILSDQSFQPLIGKKLLYKHPAWSLGWIKTKLGLSNKHYVRWVLPIPDGPDMHLPVQVAHAFEGALARGGYQRRST